MKKNNSIRGDYAVGYDISSPVIRDFQGLLDSRNLGLQNMGANFTSPEHKMEFVKTFRGIDFINDSSCCNVNGIYLTLSNVQQKITWISAFSDWSQLTDELLQLMISKVSNIIFYKELDAPAKIFLDALNIYNECAPNIETAVRAAFYATHANQPIVFCPGVDVNGDFLSYAERGDAFKDAVAQL